MVSLAGFDPSLIHLVGIYHEAHGNLQRTNVYANGVMQVMLFLSVNYGGDEGYEEQIKKYVHNNAVIYELDDINGGQKVVTWKKSSTSNGYPHDIEYLGLMKKNDSLKSPTSDIRVPFFFTVPYDADIKKKKWVGKLGSIQTKVPLIVETRKFQVASENFEIVSRGLYMKAELRVLRYKEGKFGTNQTPLKMLTYKGIKFRGANSWIAMIESSSKKAGAFVEYRSTEPMVGDNSKFYYQANGDWVENGDRIPFAYERETSRYGWEDGIYIPESAVDAAWNEGIVIIKIAQSSLHLVRFTSDYIIFENWREYEFEIEDTFGCRMHISIDWDYGGNWFATWAVSKAYPIRP